MKLEMISTGEEVLSGQIVDTNAAWFSNTMMNLGVELQSRSTVGDRIQDLVSIFTERSKQADIILVNGGLGPTCDDLSAEAAAQALGEELKEDANWRHHLEQWFAKRNRSMPSSNLKQCLLPESAVLIDNPSGSAPGFRIRLNQAWLFFTPGVPLEFKQMIEEQFVPFLHEQFALSTDIKLERFLTLGHGESSLAEKLDKLDTPEGITLGYRPSMPHIEIKVFARGKPAIDQLKGYTEQVKTLLADAVVAHNCSSIAETVHKLLIENKKTLSLAESCTGGLLTNQLIEFPGCSNYLHQGLITYSNQSKIAILGVSERLLQNYGAVSIETARAMAEQARKLQKSHFALSTTGIAGPAGGSEEKPVGTVCIALSSWEYTWVQTVQLSQRSRSLVRLMSSAIALDMLRRALLGNPPIIDYPFVNRVERKIFPTN